MLEGEGERKTRMTLYARQLGRSAISRDEEGFGRSTCGLGSAGVSLENLKSEIPSGDVRWIAG